MDDLGEIRKRTRAEVEQALKSAEAELSQLDSRRSRLQEEIAAARHWLGLDDDEEPHEKLSLHEAMARVLRESGNGGLRAPELAAEVNRRGLYRMRDGSPVGAHQIHARVHNYPKLFKRGESGIMLRGV